MSRAERCCLSRSVCIDSYLPNHCRNVYKKVGGSFGTKHHGHNDVLPNKSWSNKPISFFCPTFLSQKKQKLIQKTQLFCSTFVPKQTHFFRVKKPVPVVTPTKGAPGAPRAVPANDLSSRLEAHNWPAGRQRVGTFGTKKLVDVQKPSFCGRSYFLFLIFRKRTCEVVTHLPFFGGLV